MKTNEYFDYLLYIGVILPENINQIKEIIQKEKFENKDKSIIVLNLMGDYLSSLNKESLFKLGVNIYNQYKKNKSITIYKHLIKVLNILQNKLYKNGKYLFKKWKNIYYSKYNFNTDNIRNRSSDKLIKLNNYYNDINISKYTIYNNDSQKSQREFFERMNQYNNKKENNKKYQQSLKEEEINFLCTFSPDLSLTKNNNKKINIKNYSKEKIEEEKPKRKVDNNRMIKLYNDYQNKRIKAQKLKENIDKENGITFSPKLNNNSKYNKKIKNNFYERNKKSINDKKYFVDGFNLLRDLQMKGLDINRISIDISNIKK